MEKYRLYCEGKGHNFQHEGNYEGSWIVLRLFIDNQLVERKSEVKSGKTIRDFLFEELPTIYKIGYGVYTHGVTVNLDMSLKELLDYWSYNDGFCYLKIVEGST